MGQTFKARLSGVVSDANAAPVPEAKLTAVQTSIVAVASAVTDNAGDFSETRFLSAAGAQLINIYDPETSRVDNGVRSRTFFPGNCLLGAKTRGRFGKRIWKNYAPRFGFAYRMNPQTVVRGGYGLFYLPIGLETAIVTTPFGGGNGIAFFGPGGHSGHLQHTAGAVGRVLQRAAAFRDDGRGGVAIRQRQGWWRSCRCRSRLRIRGLGTAAAAAPSHGLTRKRLRPRPSFRCRMGRDFCRTSARAGCGRRM